MKWLKEIEAWLLPIKHNCGEASYEASAIDFTLKKVKELEDELENIKVKLEEANMRIDDLIMESERAVFYE